MKLKQTGLLLCLMLALSGRAADSTNRLRFPLNGFSIAPLEAAPGPVSQSTLMMFLPSNGKFAANVNVLVQVYPGTIEDYSALTLKQFKDNDIKLVEKKSVGKLAVVMEYAGDMQGRPLHWYARAEKSGEHVYLTTATAAESDWDKQSAQLKACVDSFRCENGK